jgi:hypothetical protein
VATFGAWLDQQRERQDQVGSLARLWAECEGERPRVYSLTGVTRFLEEHPGGELEDAGAVVEAALAAAQEYRTGRQDLAARSQAAMTGGDGDPAWRQQVSEQLERIEDNVAALVAWMMPELAGLDGELASMPEEPVMIGIDWASAAGIAEAPPEDEVPSE